VAVNTDSFGRAKQEAERFIEACNRLEHAILDPTGGYWDWPITGTKETGAVKRASMDLTRALSAMRKAN
jgi:hypothetical protein